MIPPNFVGDARHLQHLGDGVDADDVGAVQDGGCDRRRGGPVAFLGGTAAEIGRAHV